MIWRVVLWSAVVLVDAFVLFWALRPYVGPALAHRRARLNWLYRARNWRYCDGACETCPRDDDHEPPPERAA